MSAESEDSRLPFEPQKKRQKPAKAKATPVTKSKESPVQKDGKKSRLTKEEVAIPKVVSQRMVKRVVGFCGVPTFLGISTLVANYLLVSFTDIKLAPIAVLLVNLGFFGLGVLGISYGVLSASWDEGREGGLLGWQEFTVNWGRMVAAWRENRQKKA